MRYDCKQDRLQPVKGEAYCTEMEPSSTVSDVLDKGIARQRSLNQYFPEDKYVLLHPGGCKVQTHPMTDHLFFRTPRMTLEKLTRWLICIRVNFQSGNNWVCTLFICILFEYQHSYHVIQLLKGGNYITLRHYFIWIMHNYFMEWNTWTILKYKL